jgi:dynein heavy chain, axonemal
VDSLRKWMSQYVESSVEFMRKSCKEVIPTMNNNLCQSLQRIIDSMIAPFVETEIKRVANEELDSSIEYIFHFALVWSLLATVDYEGRLKLDRFHRQQMTLHKAGVQFPTEGAIYDFQYSF